MREDEWVVREDEWVVREGEGVVKEGEGQWGSVRSVMRIDWLMSCVPIV